MYLPNSPGSCWAFQFSPWPQCSPGFSPFALPLSRQIKGYLLYLPLSPFNTGRASVASPAQTWLVSWPLQLCGPAAHIHTQACPGTQGWQEGIKNSKITPFLRRQMCCSKSCWGCGDREPAVALGSGCGSLSWAPWN